MDVQQIVAWGESFYGQYPLFCYIAGGLLLLLALWKPFKVLKNVCLLLVLVAVVAAAFYLIDSMNFGVKIKNKAIHRTEKAIEK